MSATKMASALDKLLLRSKHMLKLAKNVIWAPIPNSSQTVFMLAGQLNTLVKEVLYHGGRAIGKSELIVGNYLQHVGKGWGASWNGIILRREIKSLKDLIKKSHKIIPRAFPGAEYNKTQRCWTFPNGEKLTFDFCKDIDDYAEKYHGQEFQYIAFDELTVWPDDSVYIAMSSCLRHAFVPTKTQPNNPPLQIRATTNPYGRGKGWVKEYFIDRAPAGVPVFENGKMKQMHIFGSVYENIYIAREYITDFLKAIKDPILRAAWLFGDWTSVDYSSIFGGLWSNYVAIEPFTVPKEWKVNRSFDYGQSTPFAVTWVAEANGEEVKLNNGQTFCPPKGSLIVVGELYGTEEDGNGNQVKRNAGLNISASNAAKLILAKEKKLQDGLLTNFQKIAPGPADNQIWNGDGSETPSIAKLMKAEGLEWVKSDKAPGSRRASAQIMIDLLDATKTQNPERPHIYFFKTCRYCLKYIPELQRDEGKPDEVEKGPDDHTWDALAYRLTQKKIGVTQVRQSLYA